MGSQKKTRGDKAIRTTNAKVNVMEHEAEANQCHGNGGPVSDAGSLGREGAAAASCHHGLRPSHIQSAEELLSVSNSLKKSKEFLQAFVREFDGVGGDFLEAYRRTKGEYADVWGSPEKMKFVVSHLVTCGTSKVLEGQMQTASKHASLASYFEQYLEVDFLNTRRYPSWSKIRELYAADDHTLVSFLKRRTPCSCLDVKYEQVKSISKIGLCSNPKCPLPGGITKRSDTKSCSRCRCANYCSEACQQAAWPDHKRDCNFYADRI